MSGFVRVLVLFALLLAPAAASAQRATTGTVTGRVVDSSGAVLPGVTITLQSPEALGQFTAVTDADGFYRVANLPPATYDVRAELSGFQTVIRRETVRLNGVLDVEFTLNVGSVAETVTVIGRVADRRSRARGLVGEHQQQGADLRAGDDQPPLSGCLARGAGRRHQSGDPRADRVRTPHQHGRR